MFENNLYLIVSFAFVFLLLVSNFIFFKYLKNLKIELSNKNLSLKEVCEILNESLDLILIMNLSDLQLIWCSKSVEKKLGYDIKNQDGITLEKMITPNSLSFLQHKLDQWTLNNRYENEILPIKFLTYDGKHLLAESVIDFIFEESSIPKRIALIAKDITEVKELAEEINERENRYKTFLNTAPFPVFVVRVRENKIVMMNALAKKKMDIPDGEFDGLHDGQFWENQSEKNLFLQKVKEELFVSGYIVQFKKLDQTKFWAEISGSIFIYEDVPHLIIAFFDITERTVKENKLKEAYFRLEKQYEEIHILQERLREQAIRDPLTNLYNRRFLDQTLPTLIENARVERYFVTIVIIDVDFFKHINDTYGHLVGDAVLLTLSGFYQSKLNIGELAYRYGGEEFLLVFPRLNQNVVERRMNEWRYEISELLLVPTDIHYRGSVSMGIACFPLDGNNLESILRSADQAVYRSKSEGRNRVTVFNQVFFPNT